MFVISLSSKKWGRFQAEPVKTGSSRVHHHQRPSNPKREDNLRNQLDRLGYLFLCFVLFLRSRTFPLNMFQSFL